MSLMSKAWDIQYRFENWQKNLPMLSLSTYLFVLGVLFMMTGCTLFVYVLLCGLAFNQLTLLSDPLQWFGLAITTILIYIIRKMKKL